MVSSSTDVQVIVTSYVASMLQPTSLSSTLPSTTPGPGAVAAGVVESPSAGPGGFGAGYDFPPRSSPTPWNRKRSAGSSCMEHEVRDGHDGQSCSHPNSGSGAPPAGPGPNMNPTQVMGTDNTGVRPPPSVALWLMCVLTVIEGANKIISRVLNWVSPCIRRKARNKQPERQASGDETLEDSNGAVRVPTTASSTTVLRDANGSLEERIQCLLSCVFRLLQPTALPAASCLS